MCHQPLISFACKPSLYAAMYRKLQESQHYQVLISGHNTQTNESVVVCADKRYFLDELNIEQQSQLYKKASNKLIGQGLESVRLFNG